MSPLVTEMDSDEESDEEDDAVVPTSDLGMFPTAHLPHAVLSLGEEPVAMMPHADENDDDELSYTDMDTVD